MIDEIDEIFFAGTHIMGINLTELKQYFNLSLI